MSFWKKLLGPFAISKIHETAREGDSEKVKALLFYPTATRGPVCTVVWEGRAGDRSPIPIWRVDCKIVIANDPVRMHTALANGVRMGILVHDPRSNCGSSEGAGSIRLVKMR
jgi:hypothetical protein